MVWGGVSARGKTDLWINYVKVKVNSLQYCKIIDDFARPFIEKKHLGDAIILHDRATSHTAYSTHENLSDLNFILFPAHSPNINPIMLMWAILKRYASGKNPENKAEIINFSLEGWEKIEKSVILAAITKLQQELAPKILKKQGEFIIN